MLLSACSRQDTGAYPPLSTIEKATAGYANCIAKAANRAAVRPGEVEDLAREAVGSCSTFRSKALELKSVPVFFPTIAEFDATHLGVARQAIQLARTGGG